MTKYAKLISLIAFGVLTLSGYTLYQNNSQAEKLSVELVSEEGEADVLDNLHFIGQTVNMGAHFNRGQTFEYNEGNFAFINELPILERIDYQFTPNMNRYIEDYRSFMRGKARRSNNLTETENHLVYTGMKSDVNWRVFNDNQLTISVLDKETEEEQDYEVTLSGGSNQMIQATFVNYPSLTIVAQGLDDNILNNWFIYEFDLNNPEETISPAVDFVSEFGSEHIQFASSQNKTVRFLPFRTMTVDSTDEYGQTSLSPDNYFAYDTHSGDIKALPETDDTEDAYIVLSEEETLLVGQDNGETIDWHRWNFDDDSLSELGSSEMVTPTIGRGRVHYYESTFNQGLQLRDGYLYAFEESYTDDSSDSELDENLNMNDYAFYEGSSRPQFQVIDSDSMETVFSGYFSPDESGETANVHLSMFDYGYSQFSN